MHPTLRIMHSSCSSDRRSCTRAPSPAVPAWQALWRGGAKIGIEGDGRTTQDYSTDEKSGHQPRWQTGGARWYTADRGQARGGQAIADVVRAAVEESPSSKEQDAG